VLSSVLRRRPWLPMLKSAVLRRVNSGFFVTMLMVPPGSLLP
jgi:hypothetical protein